MIKRDGALRWQVLAGWAVLQIACVVLACAINCLKSLTVKSIYYASRLNPILARAVVVVAPCGVAFFARDI
jgi:hypothetical protein